ncbi:MAG: hypothetical protein ACOYXC_12990 [Candidatus Rifleibacteriota bacterium]
MIDDEIGQGPVEIVEHQARHVFIRRSKKNHKFNYTLMGMEDSGRIAFSKTREIEGLDENILLTGPGEEWFQALSDGQFIYLWALTKTSRLCVHKLVLDVNGNLKRAKVWLPESAGDSKYHTYSRANSRELPAGILDGSSFDNAKDAAVIALKSLKVAKSKFSVLLLPTIDHRLKRWTLFFQEEGSPQVNYLSLLKDVNSQEIWSSEDQKILGNDNNDKPVTLTRKSLIVEKLPGIPPRGGQTLTGVSAIDYFAQEESGGSFIKTLSRVLVAGNLDGAISISVLGVGIDGTVLDLDKLSLNLKKQEILDLGCVVKGNINLFASVDGFLHVSFLTSQALKSTMAEQATWKTNQDLIAKILWDTKIVRSRSGDKVITYEQVLSKLPADYQDPYYHSPNAKGVMFHKRYEEFDDCSLPPETLEFGSVSGMGGNNPKTGDYQIVGSYNRMNILHAAEGPIAHFATGHTAVEWNCPVGEVGATYLGLNLIKPKLLGFIDGPPPFTLNGLPCSDEFDDSFGLVFNSLGGDEKSISTSIGGGYNFEMGGQVGWFKGSLEFDHTWTTDKSCSISRKVSTRLPVKIYTRETGDGKRALENYGIALIEGTQVSVYGIYLVQTKRLLGYSIGSIGTDRPVQDTIEFPISPTHFEIGNLRSYCLPDYVNIVNRIRSEKATREAYFDNFDVDAFKQVKDIEISDYCMENKYKVTARDLQVLAENSIDTTFQDVYSGSFNLKAMAGYASKLDVANYEFSALVGGHVNLASSRGKGTSKSQAVEVAWQSALIKPLRDGPGNIAEYSFSTFFLNPDQSNFDEFFERVVDQNWLNSDNGDAETLRKIRSQRSSCWRVIHRVTSIKDKNKKLIAGFEDDTGSVFKKAVIRKPPVIPMKTPEEMNEFLKKGSRSSN